MALTELPKSLSALLLFAACLLLLPACAHASTAYADRAEPASLDCALECLDSSASQHVSGAAPEPVDSPVNSEGEGLTAPDAPEPLDLVNSLLGSSRPLVPVADLTIRDNDPLPPDQTGTAIYALSFAIGSALFAATAISAIAMIRLHRHKYSGFDPGRTKPTTTAERILRALLS